MNSGRSCEEVWGRNGARETIQQVEKQMAVSEKRKGERILMTFPTMLVLVQGEEETLAKEKKKEKTR